MTRTRIILAILALVVTFAPVSAAGKESKGYPFQLPPANAIVAVETLKTGSKKFTLTDDERNLFSAVREGKLEKWSFAETCLIASGVTDAAKRKAYLAKLDAIEADARKAIESAKTPAEKAEKLLKFLHDGPMKSGYESKQTDLHTILDEGKFNCVSSAVLFNVIGRRLGLDLVAVEVPEHVFSVLRDGTNRYDVETTSPQGFNPKGVKTPKGEAPADRYAGNRREVGELGLASVIAYNHGVGELDEKRYNESLLSNFRALSLDPTNPSAAKNSLAGFVRWSSDLAEEAKFEEAIAVLAAGLAVSPKDSAMANNIKVTWHNYAENRMTAEKADEAIAILRRAAKAIPTGDFEKQQALLFILKGQDLAEAEKWDEALKLYNTGIEKVDAKAAKMILEARIGLFLNRSNKAIDKGEYEAALGILKEGAKVDPKDSRIKNNTRAVYSQWASTLMEKKDWAGAIAIYEKGLAHLPGDSVFKNNIAYCKQEMGK